jgi:hypothetical protein
MPSGVVCQIGCKTNPNNTCTCPLQVLDVSRQMSLMFKSSSFSDLRNYEALETWDFLASPIFWANAGLAGWLALSILSFLIIRPIRNYCLIDKVEKSEKVTRFDKALFMIMVTHLKSSHYQLD